MTPQQEKDYYRRKAIAAAGGPGTANGRMVTQAQANQDWLRAEVMRGADWDDLCTLSVALLGDLVANLLMNLENSEAISTSRRDAAYAFGHSISAYALIILESALPVTTEKVTVKS